MRKVLAFILFTILICPYLFTELLYDLQIYKTRKQVKREIISSLNKSDLVIIKLHRTQIHELRWEHSKEFEYKGHMYDIVYKKIIQDSIYYYTWWDQKESELNNLLDKKLLSMLKNDIGKEKQNIGYNIYHWKFTKQLLPNTEALFTLNRIQFSNYSNNYTSIFLNPIFHPPC